MVYDLCPYFAERPNGLGLIPYCQHKHSPAPLAGIHGGDSTLKCGGRLQFCEVPVEKQLDID